ncbi:MAG: GAF and ANTAR domain-containing protein [Actinomycetota bacterium]|nr:GAF and ANTAR domain-containing protein [Actinomycetota bacterium]
MTDSGFDPLRGLHRPLGSQGSLQDELDRIAHLARDMVAHVNHVGITILDGDTPSTAAASDPEALTLDEAQYQLGDGPCLTAHRQMQPVEVLSMAEDERWPRFTDTALAHGVHGSLSMPLTAEGESIGALNMYASTVGPFTDADRQKVESFAEQASIALANALSFLRVTELTEQLREALQTRDVIGQAKGVLMARHGITAEEAFSRIRIASQHQNRKLRTIAEDVAQLGEIPKA